MVVIAISHIKHTEALPGIGGGEIEKDRIFQALNCINFPRLQPKRLKTNSVIKTLYQCAV